MKIRPKLVLATVAVVVSIILLCIIPAGFLMFLSFLSVIFGTVYLILASVADSWTFWRD